jgi:hypothetical protein
VWSSMAPILLQALPSAMQVRLLCLYDQIILTIISGLDLANLDYLDCIPLCGCCH